MEVHDRLGHRYNLPSWFCQSCHHEEVTQLAEMPVWADAYYRGLPQDLLQQHRLTLPIKTEDQPALYPLHFDDVF